LLHRMSPVLMLWTYRGQHGASIGTIVRTGAQETMFIHNASPLPPDG